MELERQMGTQLKQLHRQLQIIHAGVAVAAAALHHQGAEQDEEIARVLEYCVASRLAAQIERTAELLASLQPLPTDPDDLDSWNPRRTAHDRIGEAVRSHELVYTLPPTRKLKVRTRRRVGGAQTAPSSNEHCTYEKCA